MNFVVKPVGRFSWSVAAILLSLASGAACAAPPHYTAMLVEAPNPNQVAVSAFAMSDTAIVGLASRSPDWLNFASFITVKHGERTVFRPFAEVSQATAVSNASDVVGNVIEKDGSQQVYLRTASGKTTRPLAGFDVAWSGASGVNIAHTIIGAYSNAAGDIMTFSLSNGVLSTLPDLGFGSSAEAINDAGTIAGWVARDTTGHLVPATWNGNALSLLPNPNPDPSGDTSATAIASNGLVAGRYYAPGTGEAHALLWSGSGVIDLGSLGRKLPYSSANGVNAAGDVVGNSLGRVNDGNSAFVYTHGTMYNLRDVTSGLADSYTIADGLAINDAGQILVLVRDKDGFNANAVLTPDKAAD